MQETLESNSATGPASTTETAVEAHSPTLMGMMAYVGPLVLIPFFLAKENPFVRFHIKQGLVLFTLELILWVLNELMLFHFLWPVVMFINFVLLILSLIGIFNVLQKKEKRLPFVGGYSERFTI